MTHTEQNRASSVGRRGAPRRQTLLAVLAFAALVSGCGGSTTNAVQTAQPGAPTASVDAGSSPITGTTNTPDLGGGSTPAASVRTPHPPGPPVPHVSPLTPPAFASRIVVPDMGIDLPIVSGDLQPPPSYPLCDVAAYVTLFGQPYETGITYISAHAQKGMFLPLLRASEVADGQSMLGLPVSVYVSDGQRFDYTISQVVRHRTDYSIVDEVPLDQQTLIMQTSEGIYGTVEKLQIIASFVSETTVDTAEANPTPHPRNCDPGASSSPDALSSPDASSSSGPLSSPGAASPSP